MSAKSREPRKHLPTESSWTTPAIEKLRFMLEKAGVEAVVKDGALRGGGLVIANAAVYEKSD